MSDNRLSIGTAQFGLPYGIANSKGQVPAHEAAEIISFARSCGVGTLDTAISYGESESVLGKAGVECWRVTTKLPALPIADNIEELVRAAVLASLERLRLPRLHAVLLHRSSDLCGRNGAAIHHALTALKGDGLVDRIGISIYDPEEIDRIWEDYPPDIVQAPLNVLDQRLVTTGWLRRLHDAGIEVHTRSVFLQGLLLLPEKSRNPYFQRWNDVFATWDAWLRQTGYTAVEAALGCVKGYEAVDRVIVGIDSRQQLEEVIRAFDAPTLDVPLRLPSDDLDLINPSRWVLS